MTRDQLIRIILGMSPNTLFSIKDERDSDYCACIEIMYSLPNGDKQNLAIYVEEWLGETLKPTPEEDRLTKENRLLKEALKQSQESCKALQDQNYHLISSL